MSPFHRTLLKTWMSYEGEVAPFVEKHDLTPEQLHDFVSDPEVRKIMDSYEELVARRLRMVAMHHQSGAAEALSKTMFETSKPDERRRAATALARLTKDMIKGPRGLAGGGLSARPTSSSSSSSVPKNKETPGIAEGSVDHIFETQRGRNFATSPDVLTK